MTKRTHSHVLGMAAFGVAATMSWGFGSPAVLAPQPAQAIKVLSGSTGASAAALYAVPEIVSNIVKWPAGFTAGSSAEAGTPCSTIDLLPGEAVTNHIQVLGSARRCVPLSYPPVFGQSPGRPYGSALVVTRQTTNGVAQGVRIVAQATTIVKWSDLWTTAQPMPAAGTPCSPVDMLPGEATPLHVQVWFAGSPWSRCVENTLPAYAN